MKATDSILTKQNDEFELARSVNTILHVIQDFTPYACRRELENRLYDFFEKDEIELTNKQMRKEYEAWKSLQIDGLLK